MICVGHTERIRGRYIKDNKEKFLKQLNGLGEIATAIGCTQAQLCLAWCIMNKDVSTALIGASKVEQVEENLKALDVMKKWTPEVEKKIEEVMQNKPETDLNFRYWTPLPSRREAVLDLPKPATK